MKRDRKIIISKNMITRYFKTHGRPLRCNKCNIEFHPADIAVRKVNPKGKYYCKNCFRTLYFDPLISDEELAKEDEELETYFLEMRDTPIDS